MTIKTLEYIHKVLKKAEKRAETTYKNADKLLDEYTANNGDITLINSQKKAVEKYRREYFEAIDILEEFEDTNFKG